VLREQRRHLVGGLLRQPVRGAVEFGEAIGPGDVAPAQLGRGPRDELIAVTPLNIVGTRIGPAGSRRLNGMARYQLSGPRSTAGSRARAA